MTTTQLKAIESQITRYLEVTGVRDEIRYFLENNAILDDEGEEIEVSASDFDYKISLDLSYTK